jgi:hypothetical protein
VGGGEKGEREGWDVGTREGGRECREVGRRERGREKRGAADVFLPFCTCFSILLIICPSIFSQFLLPVQSTIFPMYTLSYSSYLFSSLFIVFLLLLIFPHLAPPSCSPVVTLRL